MPNIPFPEAAKAEMLELLLRAAESEVGLSIKSSNSNLLRRRFFQVRSENKEKYPVIADVQVRVSPRSIDEVWLVVGQDGKPD